MKNLQFNNLFKEKFQGSRVFITGHTGFKGSWLAYILHNLGAEVMGYALAPTKNQKNFDLLKLNSKIHHLDGNVNDREKLTKCLQSFEPEFVFHLAAQSLVLTSYEKPFETIFTNVMGSVNILEAVRECPSVRSLVYITSDKCYENVEWVWSYRENDLLGGHDPYSASKAAAEIVFSAYLRSYFIHMPFLGAASARAGNVIGGGDWSIDRIIPDCIRSIEAKKPVFLRNPNSTRPWQHVLEPLSGYLLLASRLHDEPKKLEGAWNFGPDSKEVLTVKEVAKTLIKHIGRGEIEMASSPVQVHEASLLQLNCEKANQLLGWYPRWRIDKTIEATAVWYKTILDGGSAEKITLSQIKEFFTD